MTEVPHIADGIAAVRRTVSSCQIQTHAAQQIPALMRREFLYGNVDSQFFVCLGSSGWWSAHSFRLSAVVPNPAGQLTDLREVVLLVYLVGSVRLGEEVSSEADSTLPRFIQQLQPELFSGLVF
jgi:hypothetical protein